MAETDAERYAAARAILDAGGVVVVHPHDREHVPALLARLYPRGDDPRPEVIENPWVEPDVIITMARPATLLEPTPPRVAVPRAARGGTPAE